MLFCSIIFRKNNRTAEASRMLERCISLEPEFLPAYLELIKMRPGFGAGKLLRDIVRLNPTEQDRIVQYGFWLLENGNKIITFNNEMIVYLKVIYYLF